MTDPILSMTRRIKLFVACSLDGYIAGPNGEVDWLFDPDDFDFRPFFDSIDTVIMGRKTYDFAVAHEHGIMSGVTNYVLTRSTSPPDDDSVRFVSDDISDFVQSLRNRGGLDIWLMGGGELASGFLEADLVDDIVLGLHPMVLGDGISLFPGRHDRRRFTLDDCLAYENGLVLLTYRRTTDN